MGSQLVDKQSLTCTFSSLNEYQTSIRMSRVLPVTLASNSCLLSCVRCAPHLPRNSGSAMTSQKRGPRCLLFRRAPPLSPPPSAAARSLIRAITAEAGNDFFPASTSLPFSKTAPCFSAAVTAAMSVSGMSSDSFAGGWETGVPPVNIRASGLRGRVQERFNGLFEF